jgi:hypothetical protein
MGKYKKRDAYHRLYEVLSEMETQGRTLSVKEIAEKTNYKAGSVGAYVRNKLKNIYLYENESGKYVARGVNSISYEYFFFMMTQKSHVVEQGDDSLFLNLINRSLQAFYLAIGTYNNPILKYRVESFSILVANAWELLLKARIIELLGEDEIKRSDDKTISLLTAVKKVFPTNSNPIRKNIEKINELRDKSIHLLIPDIQKTLSRIFQASVLNYLECLEEYKYNNPYGSELPGLLSLISDKDELDDINIIGKYGDHTKSIVKDFLEKFGEEERDINSYHLAIPLEYKVVLTKKEEEGDLKLSLSKEGKNAKLIEVPKDHNRTHPYLQKDIISRIKEFLIKEKINKKFTSYIFQGMLLYEGIKSSKDNQYYHLIENPKTHTYSEQLIELIIHKLQSNEEYVQKCKNVWAKYLNKKRKEKSP